MTEIHFVRHGQAGSRTAYDTLSDTGRRQAELLGRYLVSQQIRFDAAWTGTLQRQRETAETVRREYVNSGGVFPEPQPHPGWNEFDLDAVYASLAPILREEDEAFRREHDEMLAEIEAAGNHDGASIHRRWTQCDVKIVQAWIGGRYDCATETWREFRDRVTGSSHLLEHGEKLIVFTSATPIAVWCALAMDIFDERALRLAGALLNSSVSVLHRREDSVRMHTFNSVPHLTAPELRTYR